MGSAGAHKRWPTWTSTFIHAEPPAVPPRRRCQRPSGRGRCAVDGLIATLADRDVRIDLLAVTEDDGSPPGDPNATPPWLLGQRRASRQVAYRRLGVRACRRDSLKLTAGKVDDAGIDIGAALSEILDFSPGSADSIWVVAPWRQEPHPDHAAVGHAAAIACHAYSAQLLEYPVGVWHRDDPAELPWVSPAL
jgi:LmbE family N-acetylglucosaminyl deacetylase